MGIIYPQINIGVLFISFQPTTNKIPCLYTTFAYYVKLLHVSAPPRSHNQAKLKKKRKMKTHKII